MRISCPGSEGFMKEKALKYCRKNQQDCSKCGRESRSSQGLGENKGGKESGGHTQRSREGGVHRETTETVRDPNNP